MSKMTLKKWVVLLTVALYIITGLPVVNAQTPPEKLLLKDYRPVSIYKVPVTIIQKAKYPVIDMHSHPYAETKEQIAQWVKTMDQVGIEKVIIHSMATGAKFDSIYAEYAKYPGRFEVWCGFDYTGYDKPGFGPAAVKELERCFKAGATGVGELGDKGKGMFYCDVKAWGMHLDDPRMDLLLEKCADLKMPINIHIADPIWMYEKMDSTNDGLMNAYEWRLDNQPDIIGHAGMINILENAVKRHPRTTFIACHFANCSYNLDRLGAMLDKYPNLYADISARYAETAPIPRFVARFYDKYQDRLVYGTDMGFDKSMYQITFRILESTDEHFYETNQFGYHWALNGFGLPEPILHKVYRQNALRILNK
ncbi:MAG TPA: amidohydrolase family protein [bacterium]|nr:amidohydrolase family protein [bacterium]HPN43581.1 amidohydrolase family protein [bacterium]